MGPSEWAAAIVMNPNSGHVLAMVSIPSYDNNVFSGKVRPSELEKLLADPRKPMINYAISGAFPPGSTFKLVTGLAALQEGVANADTEIVCQGALYVANEYNPAITQRFPCWGSTAGRTSFRVSPTPATCTSTPWGVATGTSGGWATNGWPPTPGSSDTALAPASTSRARSRG